MADEDDFDRWLLGRDHWNNWATRLLEEQRELMEGGNWLVDAQGNGSNRQTKKWIASASVNFSKQVFHSGAEFSHFIFPHSANFVRADFRNVASFMRATFRGAATFDATRFARRAKLDGAVFKERSSFFEAVFSERATFASADFGRTATFRGARFGSIGWFGQAKFREWADFKWSIFSEGAHFRRTEFQSSAWFDNAELCRFGSFDKAEFKGVATFVAVVSDGNFSLANARFGQVPDFDQMSFRAAPSVDNLRVVSARSFQMCGDKKAAARYRALKRIAIAGHDHVRELEFFASETLERRGHDDSVWSARWFASLLYELLSDFGRSIARPVGWWLLLTVLFPFIYLYLRDLSAWHNCYLHFQLPIKEAIYLSFANSLPFVGLGKIDQIRQISSCLYGVEMLPLAIASIGALQTLLSTVFLFLTILALRNHFKIK